MARLDCPIAERLLKPLSATPLLSIVVLSHRHLAELKLAVESLATQITGALEGKVEIIITDDGSGADSKALIQALAEAFPSVSFLLHAKEEGGFFTMFAAPWRARGRYCWTFGSDDLVLDGGIAAVVEVLERETPCFLTLNRRTALPDLSALVWERANTVPDRTFDGFEDLLCAFGLDQFGVVSCQIELTERARALDAEPYLRTDTHHSHVAAFLEKHHDRKSVYSADDHVVQRLAKAQLAEYHSGNFLDYAAAFPSLLWAVIETVRAPKDLFDRITGYKRIDSYDPPDLTFVDNILENMLHAAGNGEYISAAQKRTIEQALAYCRPDRPLQFEQVWEVTQELVALENGYKRSESALGQAREAAIEGSAVFTVPNF